MAHGRRDYTGDEVKAAQSVLAELVTLLSDYEAGIVVIGGWVPYFIIPQAAAPHEGTKDVDLALDPRRLQQDADDTIEDILMKALYQQDTKQAFRWYKTVVVEARPIEVIIDFLTGENEGQALNGQLQRIQDIRASTIHGCDVAFLQPLKRELEAQLPDGSKTKVAVNIASAPMFLVMKGIALHSRHTIAAKVTVLDEITSRQADARKDAYDIYYTIKHFPTGLTDLMQQFQPYLNNPTVQEGLAKIAINFAALEATGPRYIAAREADPEAREMLQRDAYEQVNALLAMLQIIDNSG